MPFPALQDQGTSSGLAQVVIVALVLSPLIAAWSVRERWLPSLGRCISEPGKWLGLLIGHVVHPPLLYRLGETATNGSWLQVPCPIHHRRDCTPCSLNCQVSSGLIAAGLIAGIGAVIHDRTGPGALAFYAWMGSAIAITFVRGLLQAAREDVERARGEQQAAAARDAQAAPVAATPAPVPESQGGTMSCPLDAQSVYVGARQCEAELYALRCTRPDGHLGTHHSHDRKGHCDRAWEPEPTLDDQLDAIWDGAASFLRATAGWLLKVVSYVVFPPALFTGWKPHPRSAPPGELRCATHDRRWCGGCMASWFVGFVGVFVMLGIFADRAEKVGAFGAGQWPFLAWFAVMLIASPYLFIRGRLSAKALRAGLALDCPVDAQPEAFMHDRWAKPCGQPAIGGIGLVCNRQNHHAGPHHGHDAEGACMKWGQDEDGFAWPLRLIGHTLFPPSAFHPLQEEDGCSNHRMPACSHCLSARYFGFLVSVALMVLGVTLVISHWQETWYSPNGSRYSGLAMFLLFWLFINGTGFAWLKMVWGDRRILMRARSLDDRPRVVQSEPQAAEFIEPEAVLPPNPEPPPATRTDGAQQPTEEELQALAAPPAEGVAEEMAVLPLPPEPAKPYAELLARIQATAPEEATPEVLSEFESLVTAFEQEQNGGRPVPELREALTGLVQMASAARQ